MNFGEAIASYFKNYANVNGRASRNEYWFTVLFQVLVCFVILVLPTFVPYMLGTLAPQVLILPWLLATVTPGICVTIRRLHDVGLPSSAYFMPFVFFETLKPGQPYPNQWGNPVR
jgi:uncharacterized membrane protein YhaH (DUF805 family)